jgi:nitroreductase
MELSEIISTRHSSRQYVEQPVDDDAIDSILEAINAAPSAGNHQAYKVAVVRDADKRRCLMEASGPQGWMSTAPVFLVFFADLDQYSSAMGDRLADCVPIQDATIAQAYAQLEASDLNLGSCWVAPFAGTSAQEILGLKGNLKLTGILTLGHSHEGTIKRKRRKPQDWSVKI